MSPKASDFSWQETRGSFDDMQNGEDESSSVSAGSNPAEIAYAEIGDNNGVSSQFASYRAVRLGGSQGANPRSEKGKIYADIDSDDSGTATDSKTQIRFIKRPLNGDSRTILTEWMTVRGLEESGVEDRVVLPPATDSQGRPLVVQEGDVLAVEARNPSTSFTIDRTGSDLEFPIQVGH